jgi:hypothetical protein
LLAKEVPATAPVHEVTRLIQFQRHPRQVRALPIRGRHRDQQHHRAALDADLTVLTGRLPR